MRVHLREATEVWGSCEPGCFCNDLPMATPLKGVVDR